MISSQVCFSFTTFLAGPLHKTSIWREHADPAPRNERDSPALTGQVEENDEPEERGEGSLMDDRDEEDARSSGTSRGDSCDTGELQQIYVSSRPSLKIATCDKHKPGFVTTHALYM